MTQKEALEILKMGGNVFLTGGPGSGKTFLLNEYIKFLKNRNVRVDVTASTGIAATHLNGITIHSWAGIGIKDALNDYEMDWLMRKSKARSRITKTKVLIIDEVSMLHSFRLDLVDEVCRNIRQDSRPFGGIQVILSGDLFQLPPISRNDNHIQFVHQSRVWEEMGLKICYLSEQHRHSDKSLIKILNDIRISNISEETLACLQSRFLNNIKNNSFKYPTATKLYTHNVDVDSVNQRHLDTIEEEEKSYLMFVKKGSKPAIESLKKSCMAPENLRLKSGAIVMFVKNSSDQKYFNGTLGTVVAFDSSGNPIIQTFSGRNIIARREEWNFEEDGKVKASISQFPLRLAWAITIHKSQGMSLDSAEIDLSKSFVEGMGYVALSRIRSLDGLKLIGLNETALRVNEEVLELDKELQQRSKNEQEAVNEISQKEKEEIQNKFITLISEGNFSASGKIKNEKGFQRKKIKTTFDITKDLVLQKFLLSEMAEEREMNEDTIISHLEKLIERGDELDLEYLKPTASRFEKIKLAFEKTKGKKLTPVRKILGSYFSYNEIKLVRLFL